MAKYLIRSDFKATRKGEFVTANESAGEFVYETGNGSNLTSGQIFEIADANKLSIPKSLKKGDAIAKLDELLETLKLDEVNKMTDTAMVEKICEAGVAAGKTDDEILIEIVTSGVKFGVAGKLFRQVMEAKGFRVSNSERSKKAEELLGDVELATSDDVAEAIETLTQNIPDTNEKQALVILRRFAKAKEIELPKVAKREKGHVSGFRGVAYRWMIENPAASNKDLTAFIESHGKGESVVKRMCQTFDFAKRYAAAAAK